MKVTISYSNLRGAGKTAAAFENKVLTLPKISGHNAARGNRYLLSCVTNLKKNQQELSGDNIACLGLFDFKPGNFNKCHHQHSRTNHVT